jgi:alkylation response protein AidB-like acyl-CoA dehydrogenase
MSTEAAFAWDDPLCLDEQLSDEERAVRDAAHDYCQSSLQPRVMLAARHERFDRQILTEMGSLGLLGATLPEAYGGSQAQPCGLWADCQGGGASRFGLSFRHERAVVPGDVSHLCLRE